VQSRLHGSHVSAEFLIDPLIALRDDLVGVVHEAAADAWNPGSHTPTAFSPTVHAFSVEGYL
jgi:hypothetical protein